LHLLTAEKYIYFIFVAKLKLIQSLTVAVGLLEQFLESQNPWLGWCYTMPTSLKGNLALGHAQRSGLKAKNRRAKVDMLKGLDG